MFGCRYLLFFFSYGRDGVPTHQYPISHQQAKPSLQNRNQQSEPNKIWIMSKCSNIQMKPARIISIQSWTWCLPAMSPVAVAPAFVITVLWRVWCGARRMTSAGVARCRLRLWPWVPWRWTRRCGAAHAMRPRDRWFGRPSCSKRRWGKSHLENLENHGTKFGRRKFGHVWSMGWRSGLISDMWGLHKL